MTVVGRRCAITGCEYTWTQDDPVVCCVGHARGRSVIVNIPGTSAGWSFFIHNVHNIVFIREEE